MEFNQSMHMMNIIRREHGYLHLVIITNITHAHTHTPKQTNKNTQNTTTPTHTPTHRDTNIRDLTVKRVMFPMVTLSPWIFSEYFQHAGQQLPGPGRVERSQCVVSVRFRGA